MIAVVKKNATISRLLQSYNNKTTSFLTDPVTRIHSSITKNQAQSKEYLKFPQFLRRSTRDSNGISPALFLPAFFRSSYSSSATATSFSELGFVGWYLAMVKSRPVLTKSVTCSLIYIAADLSSQAIVSSEPYDSLRTIRMAGYGLLVLGPTLHFWFNFVSKAFPKRDLISTLKKMVLGQSVYGPIMTVIFFSLNAALQGESRAEITARLKRDLIPTMLNGVMYWPVCDFITFRFIPVHLQPLASNSFSYLWTIYMTYMAGLDKASS